MVGLNSGFPLYLILTDLAEPSRLFKDNAPTGHCTDHMSSMIDTHGSHRVMQGIVSSPILAYLVNKILQIVRLSPMVAVDNSRNCSVISP